MRRKSTKIAIAIAAAAVIAAGGAALTASNTLPATTIAGYNTTSVSGATATKITYTLSLDGTQITDAALTFNSDVTQRVVKAGFGADDLTGCTVGAYNAGTTSTPVTCTGFTQDTHDSATFHVAVTETP